MSTPRVFVFTAAALASACTERVGAPPDLGLSTDTGVEGPLMPKGNLLIEEVYYPARYPQRASTATTAISSSSSRTLRTHR